MPSKKKQTWSVNMRFDNESGYDIRLLAINRL